MPDLVRLGSEDVVHQLQCLGGPSHPAEHQREVCFCGSPAGCELDRPPEQILGVAPAPDPSGEFGEHADCRGVERVFLEVRLQDPLGDVEPIVIQRHRRLDQARMPVRANGCLCRHWR